MHAVQIRTRSIFNATLCHQLKGTATLMISMFCKKELYKPWVLIQVSSQYVEKIGNYGGLKFANVL